MFKGGTSLPKAYRLIDRFSKDVDLLVVTPSQSKGAAERSLKSIAAAVGDALGITGLVDTNSATKGRKRTVSYRYPTQHDASGLLPEVRLELGARGGTLPMRKLSIGSLVTEYAQLAGIDSDFVEAEMFELWVLEPVRTRFENLMILHNTASRDDAVEQAQHARHYYDVWCLLSDDATIGSFSQWPCDALAREVETFTAAAGLETSPRPSGGFARSPAFVSATRHTRDAYKQDVLGDLVWGSTNGQPTFEECCELVVKNARLL